MGSVSPSERERERKRVRFSSNGSGPPGSPPKTPMLRAGDVVELRFLHNASDLSAAGAASPHAANLTSRPPFLHQIVPKESIQGWRELTVAVYIHLPSLSYWLDESGEPADLPTSERTEVLTLLAPFVKGGLCPTRAAFEAELAVPAPPPLSGRVLQYEKGDRRFVVYKESFFSTGEGGDLVRNEDFLSFHRRMAFLMFVHIDGASFIDDDDPRWEVYVVMEETEGSPPEFVGYATTYPFSVLTKSGESDRGMMFADRIRISQVFISPLQQGRGHGSKVLHAIYKDAKARNAIEVTVEDPSRGFRILRDVTDLKRSYAAGILDSGKPFSLKMEAELLALLRKDMLLTAGQAKRCLEVHQLRYTDQGNEEEYKKYRLWVKRRLFKENYEVLDNYDKEERKVKLAEIYEDYEKEYCEAITRLQVNRTQQPSG